MRQTFGKAVSIAGRDLQETQRPHPYPRLTNHMLQKEKRFESSNGIIMEQSSTCSKREQFVLTRETTCILIPHTFNSIVNWLKTTTSEGNE